MAGTKIEMRASFDGVTKDFVSSVIWFIIWSVGVITCWSGLTDYQDLASEKTGLTLGLYDTIQYFWKGDSFGPNWGFFVWLVIGCFCLLVAFGMLTEVWDCFYHAKTVTVIDTERKTITETGVKWLNRPYSVEFHFDQIRQIEVNPTTLENFFECGSVHFEYVPNMNAPSVAKGWKVEWLRKPFLEKEQLALLLSESTSMAVTIEES